MWSGLWNGFFKGVGMSAALSKYFLMVMVLLAAVSSSATAKRLDKAEVWNLYRDGESSFRQANELRKTDPVKSRELFEKAALCFETLQREGGIQNGRLFYNLGNVYFRLGEVGKAILNYRRAGRLIPNDINLQQNLNFARSRRLDKIEAKPQTQVYRTLFFWHYDLNGLARAWLFAACFSCLWVLAGVYVLKRAAWLRHAALGCALLSLLLAGSLGVEAYEQAHVRSGVILDQEVIGRKGDSTTFEPTFKDPLHTGVEFHLVEERKGWLHIELVDGRRCWVPESAAGII
jgi:tetratricopeptide (TPR) repeat protein